MSVMTCENPVLEADEQAYHQQPFLEPVADSLAAEESVGPLVHPSRIDIYGRSAFPNNESHGKSKEPSELDLVWSEILAERALAKTVEERSSRRQRHALILSGLMRR